MALEDIAYTLFVEVLGMAQYPGAPFTGNVIRDVILFLFIPSVFIILFVYMLLGRLCGAARGAQMKLRLLMGIALYLFIVAGGYYSTFALLAGPYFLFLIFVLGLLYFIPAHFGFRHEDGHYPEAARKHRHARGWTPQQRIEYLRSEIERLEARHAKSKSDRETEFLAKQLEDLREELEDEEAALQPWRRRRAT